MCVLQMFSHTHRDHPESVVVVNILCFFFEFYSMLDKFASNFGWTPSNMVKIMVLPLFHM